MIYNTDAVLKLTGVFGSKVHAPGSPLRVSSRFEVKLIATQKKRDLGPYLDLGVRRRTAANILYSEQCRIRGNRPQRILTASRGTGRVTERDGWGRPESDDNTLRNLGGCRPS